jgi:hypothetical protein
MLIDNLAEALQEVAGDNNSKEAASNILKGRLKSRGQKREYNGQNTLGL